MADLLALTDRGLIAELDNFEDYRPDNPRRSEYIRREARLIGKTVDAQSYFYARACDNLPIVAGDDWLRHAGKTGAREG